MSIKPLTDEEGEVRELTTADLKSFRPAAEVLPAELLAVLPKRKPGQRGPQKTPTKQQVTLRIDTPTLERIRATGPGWQGRINEVLAKAFTG